MIKTKIAEIISDYADKAGIWNEKYYPNMFRYGEDYVLIGSPLENLEKDVIGMIILEGGIQPVCNKSIASTCDGECLEVTYTFSYLEKGTLKTYSDTIYTEY